MGKHKDRLNGRIKHCFFLSHLDEALARVGL